MEREEFLRPLLCSLHNLTVQAVLATKRSAHSSPPVSNTPPQSTVLEVLNSLVPVSMVSSCFGGVPSLLCSSASGFLAAGTGLWQQGWPAFSLNMVAPSFVSTFVNPSMSAARAFTFAERCNSRCHRSFHHARIAFSGPTVHHWSLIFACPS